MSFKDNTIIVGRNNAGKSTLIEALRTVATVAQRAPYLNFDSPPEWVDAPIGSKGIRPSLRGLHFNFHNLGHGYSGTPTSVKSEFSSKVKINVYLNSQEEEVYAVVMPNGMKAAISKSQVFNSELPSIRVMPPLRPLEMSEDILNYDYVFSSQDSYLHSRHFRNQLYYFRDDFKAFCDLAEASWPGLRIDGLEEPTGDRRDIRLFVRDGKFVGEIGVMGQGLQTWLQMVWFLVISDDAQTIVLDEPDVHLHADMQRQLLKIIKSRFDQTIIATHSLEILSEVAPEDILIVEKSRNTSKFAPTLPAVQNLVDHIGGAQNIHLTRLWSARRCLFVEGDDMDFLNIFHSKLFPKTNLPISLLPCIPLGGFGNWPHAVGGAIGLKNAGDQRIECYCILDKDYYTPAQIKKVVKSGVENGLNVHVWERKEIENYLLIPEAIERIIKSNRNDGKGPKISTIVNRIEKICDNLRTEATDLIAVQLLHDDRKLGLKTANERARQYVQDTWTKDANGVGLISGKRIISELSKWSKKNYNVSFSASALARAIEPNEIHPEVRKVMKSIENTEKF